MAARKSTTTGSKKTSGSASTKAKKKTTQTRKSGASAGTRKTGNTAKAKTSRSGSTRKAPAVEETIDYTLHYEIFLWVVLGFSVLIFISYLGMGGSVGKAVSGVCFGLFGTMAYLLPFLLFFMTAFLISNFHSRVAKVKASAVCLLFLAFCGFMQMILIGYKNGYSAGEYYQVGASYHSGGGLFGGLLAGFFTPAIGKAGTYIVLIILTLISLILITQKSFMSKLKTGSKTAMSEASENRRRRKEWHDRQLQIAEERRREKERLRLEMRARMELEDRQNSASLMMDTSDSSASFSILPKGPRMDRKISGVTTDTTLTPLETISSSVPVTEELPSYSSRPKRSHSKVQRNSVDNENEEMTELERLDDIFARATKLRRSAAAQARRELQGLSGTEEDAVPAAQTEKHRLTPEPVIDDTEEIAAPEFTFSAEPNAMDSMRRINSAIRSNASAAPVRTTAEKVKNDIVFETLPVNSTAEETFEPEPELSISTYSSATAVKEEPSRREEYFEEESYETAEAVSAEELMEAEAASSPAALKAAERPAAVSRPSSASETAAPKERSASRPHADKEEVQEEVEDVSREIAEGEAEKKKEYIFPSVDLLQKPDPNKTGTSEEQLRATALKLQQVFTTFGVDVKITNVVCGPSVTRYELTPAMGVKVSKILSLQDDIKLNLAASDIRIEAPIPGKSAIGIEVPNKVSTGVMLRELLQSPEFTDHPSRLAYAVGKDISGKIIVSDIAKMPHLLIAGATGSGKSVFINTLIMSIIYHSSPEDVKMIMIDPKVVELSVYNGIPHLYIPVVTDPKKAAGALNWGVAEMTARYKKFADCGVRDIKGYNKRVEMVQADPAVKPEDKPEKMPQIVIIVDELADLMMVASGEVEDAICRLAQLARAAGIHLVIATQRPSVDVITGLIKANMPSRIAFSVSSGVDSRTILDMNGAEKLLGNGDMLFAPQTFKNPLRVQGAFVSDAEVSEVTDFIKQNNSGEDYSAIMQERMETVAKSASSAAGGGSDVDELFADAGKFIIQKDKASIGTLQRWFKIGFNRAARIMDQLADAGVVGPEEGTKPRKIIMSMEQFEDYLEQN